MPFVMNFGVLNHESFNHCFCNWACFILVDFYTRVELNMFLHICSSCGGIGGGVRLKKGEMEVKRMSWFASNLVCILREEETGRDDSESL